MIALDCSRWNKIMWELLSPHRFFIIQFTFIKCMLGRWNLLERKLEHNENFWGKVKRGKF